MVLLWLALGFVLGLWASRQWDVPTAAIVLSLVSLAGVYLLLRSWGIRALPLMLLLLGLLLGVVRGGPQLLDVGGDLAHYHGQVVEIEGVITSLPEISSDQVRLELKPSQLRTQDGEWTPVTDPVMVWTESPSGGEPLAYGDRVLLIGRVDAPEPFGGFDYPLYLASQGIGSVMRGAAVVEVEPGVAGAWFLREVHAARRELALALDASLPEPQASLSKALLLGLRESIPEEIATDFRRSGAAHLLAVSGMHIALVLVSVLGISNWILGHRRNLYLLPPFLLVWSYVLLAGAPPSAVRAAIMGSAYLLAMATGRLPRPIISLALAAALMLVWEPRWLWHLSFQLSFTAMAGVLLIGLPAWLLLQRHWSTGKYEGKWQWRIAALAMGGVLLSGGAVLGTLPLVAFNFHQVPLLGIPVTMLVFPALPFLVGRAFITAVLGVIWEPLGWITGWTGWLPGWWLSKVVHVGAAPSWGVVDVESFSSTLVWGYYIIMASALAVLYRYGWLPGTRSFLRLLWKGPQHALAQASLLSTIALAGVVIWVAALGQSDGRMHVYFLDVGQGDAALVRTPGGYNVLIDGGPSGEDTLLAVDRLLPVWDRQIDVGVLSQPDADHRVGITEMAKRGRIDRLLTPPVAEDDGWLRELSATKTTLVDGRAGTVVTLPDGTWLEVIHPPTPAMAGTSSDPNNNSLVVVLHFGEATVLFTGDVEMAGELVLLGQNSELSADILKVAHHGSDTSSTLAFLAAVAPSVAVISVGSDNTYGHPTPGIIARLLAIVPEENLFITSLGGVVELVTDGGRWWTESRE
jgi:competence protein ComEC